ncbi:hypothetical protein CRM22_000231 [Opisthorchis felineus]|uniref:DNA-(apurinic or apyrimidinic site) endonuclease 2 n=1 Tax=Opisthorchis felineus TaxID=147828 RepID=A0A4S2MGB8_OPIFE|nr:hypothetical protein CRM22_000231 [Opisthorchis felineus]
MQPLRVCSWNVNGLRSLPSPLKVILDSLDADIICLQETKTSRDLGSKWSCVDAYNSYFSHCTLKVGYSGVAIFCRDPLKPIAATEGFAQTLAYIDQYSLSCENGVFPESGVEICPKDLKAIDSEGRFLVAFFPPQAIRRLDDLRIGPNRPLAVISVYVPRVSPDDPNRVNFRSKFEELFSVCVNKLLRHNHVVISGDLNVYHTILDHCEPEIVTLETHTIVYRQWLNSLLTPHSRDPQIPASDDYPLPGNFVDIFRHVHPTRKDGFTCWSARTGARETNYGVRLDYILLDEVLATWFDRCTAHTLCADHMTNITGSDHCPTWTHLPLCLDVNGLNYPLPALCSRNWPQCQAKQVGLKEFLVAGPPAIGPPSTAGDNKKSGGLPCEHGSSTKNRNGQPKLKQMCLGISRSVSSNVDQFPPVLRKEQPLRETNSVESADNLEVIRLQEIVEQTDAKKAQQSAAAWQRLLSGPKKAPRCRGHNEPCVLRSVKQASTNSGSKRGRRFWVCARPQGSKDNPVARCSTFIWDDQYVP